MTWDRRGDRRYYYRSRRVDGRVRREYVGHGPEAERIAQQDAAARALTQQQRADRRTAEQAWTDFDRLAHELARAQLLGLGFYQHARGAWRQRRGN